MGLMRAKEVPSSWEKMYVKQDIGSQSSDVSIKWQKSSEEWVVVGEEVLENGYKEEVTFELDADFFLLALPKPMESASLG